MTDDFTRLRGAMTDLAEHGGSPDLYERALHTSRRLRRRSALATGATAAAGVLTLVTGVALSGGGVPGPTPPPGAHTPTAIHTTPPSPAPTSTSPSPTLSTSRSQPATRPTSERPDDGCPVTAATLGRVPGLPDGYRITSDTVECWKDWATGWDRNQQGDGMYLFRYSPSRGWRIHGQGSAFDCATLGIPKDPDDPPPFCS